MLSTFTWRFLERIRLFIHSPDFSRAMRATAAFMTPLLFVQFIDSSRGLDASLAALCSHNIALMEMRGPYKQRLFILLFMTVVLSCMATLGAIVADNVLASVLGIGMVTMFSMCWRHLSPDYGPTLAIGSMMVFLVALSVQHIPGTLPEGKSEVYLRFVYALAGGSVGTFFQVLLWPIKPQHPLRQAVADGWNHLACLCDAMRPQEMSTVTPEKAQTIAQTESELNQLLDKNVIVLGEDDKKRSRLIKQLDAVNLGTVRLTMRVTAFYSACEPILKKPEATTMLPPIDSFYVALSNLSLSIATTVVTRRAEHFGLTWLRFQRVSNLIQVLQERFKTEFDLNPKNASAVIFTLGKIEELLHSLEDDLKNTVEGINEEKFLPRLPDVGIHSLKPLTAGLNFSWPPDPILIRYALRMAALSMTAVAIYKSYQISHGYWIALTMMVVLQPNYGPTRERAAQRIIGTIAGGLFGSIFAWIHPPLFLVDTMLAAVAFLFAINLKQRYALAVFFVTIMVVLSTETLSTVSIEITQSRIYCTVTGGLCALLAAFLFWPNWEKNRFPKILAKAMSANRDYLLLITARLSSGSGNDESVTRAKRFTELACSELFTSLQRISGDPKKKQGNLPAFASLMSSTLRVTRTLTSLSLYLQPGNAWHNNALENASREIARSIEGIIRVVNSEDASVYPDESVRNALRELETEAKKTEAPSHAVFIYEQLEIVFTEIETLWLVLRK